MGFESPEDDFSLSWKNINDLKTCLSIFDLSKIFLIVLEGNFTQLFE